VTTTPKNGENFLDLIARLKDAMNEYNDRFKGKTVVLFSHAIALNAIRVLLLHESILGKNGELHWRDKGFHHAQPVQIAFAGNSPG
jgi:broad specificity phosphatase PhoE